MSRKILSSALFVSLFSVPFVYLLTTQTTALGVSGLVISTLVIIYAASAGSAWLAVRVVRPAAQSSKENRKSPRPEPRSREKSIRVADTPVVAEGPREAGQVKWFNASKGFGFITRDSGEDIFVHFRSIRGDGHRVLKDGQRVEFSVSMGDKGLQADDVSAMAR